MNNNSQPTVSIHCLAYNHEKTIRKTLDGFLMQETNFPIEAIVHDDASTDNTAAIIKEYADQYPHIIKPIFEKENQYSKHDGSLQKIMHNACRGKYIAYCEGDDYWIDPFKLQKQVDYLEAHPEITYSCCRFYVQNEFKGTFKEGYNKYFDNEIHKKETEFIFDQSYPFLEDWVTLTLTQVIRRDAIDLNFRLQFKYSRDVHLIYDVLSKGKGVCHNFLGGVSIVSEASTFGKHPLSKRLMISYNIYDELYNKTHSPLIKKCLSNCYSQLFQNAVFKFPKHIFEIPMIPKGILRYLKKYCKRLLANKK